MSDVIVVAAIAAGPAFITGLATLWVTHRRDDWERARLAALDAHERARAQAEAVEAAEGRRRQFYTECFRTVGAFVAAAGHRYRDWSGGDFEAHSRMVTAWAEARMVADASVAPVLTEMLAFHTAARLHTAETPFTVALEALTHQEALASRLTPEQNDPIG